MSKRSAPTIQDLLDAGVHFGHQTSRWNPKMRKFIFAERNGIYLIDLKKTLRQIELAQELVKNVVSRGDSVLFVCTKKQLRQVIESEAERSNSFFVTERWLGGMLTDFATIKKQIRRLRELERGQEEGAFDFYTKKERLMLDRERERLDKYLVGVKNMARLPGALFVVDAMKEKIAISEANKLGIPVIAIVDTNADPDVLTVPIAGNDDAIRSVTMIGSAISEAIIEARAAMPAEARRAADDAEVTVYSTETGPSAPADDDRARARRRPRRKRRPRSDAIVNVIGGRDDGGRRKDDWDGDEDDGGGGRSGEDGGRDDGSGGRDDGSGGGDDGGGSSSVAPEPVLLGATAPTVARPGDTFASELVAYVASAEAQAKEHLAQVERGAEVKMGTRTGVKTGAQWTPGIRVLVRLGASGLEVQPPVQEFTWDGQWASAGFMVSVPLDAPERTTVLAFEVFVAPGNEADTPVRVASLNLMLKVSADAATPEPQRAASRAARTAFASYTSEDAHEVLGRVASIRISTGLEVFLDVLKLRAGERWQPALEAAIRDAEVFLLFWSRNAAASPWVEWEWRQALAYEPPARLQIHPLETATDKIPPELKDRHFRDILILAREGMAKRPS